MGVRMNRVGMGVNHVVMGQDESRRIGTGWEWENHGDDF